MAGPAATEPCVVYAQLLKTLCLTAGVTAVAVTEAQTLDSGSSRRGSLKGSPPDRRLWMQHSQPR